MYNSSNIPAGDLAGYLPSKLVTNCFNTVLSSVISCLPYKTISNLPSTVM